jgi:hypothetical protein
MTPIEITCQCGETYAAYIIAGQRETRNDPAYPATVDPCECPACGEAVDQAAVLEDAQDAEQASRDDDADKRRKEREV